MALFARHVPLRLGRHLSSHVLRKGAAPAVFCLNHNQKMNISTRDMTSKDLEKLKVDQNRMMETLHHTCTFGPGARWGR